MWSHLRSRGWPLVVLAALLPFLNGLGGDFVWDDFSTVVDNTASHGFSHLPQLLGWGDAHFRYRLGRDVSQMLDYTLGGLNPLVYHLFNILYHAMTSWLVWVIARDITGSNRAALWGGVLFAVHAVHTDAVTYISGRRDVLSGFLALASVAAFIRYRASGHRGWFVGAAVAGLAGLLTKEMAATFPALWFLVDVVHALRDQPQRLSRAVGQVLKTHWRLYGVGGTVASAFILYVALVQMPVAIVPPHGGSWLANFMTVAVVLSHALRLLLWPTGLMVDYDGFFTPVISFADPRLSGSLMVLGLAIWSGIYAARFSTAAFFAVNWLWISYLPVMHIVPHVELFAEHYLYLPSVGFCILAGMGISRLQEFPRFGRVATVAGIAVLLLLSALTWDRNRDFSSQIRVLEAEMRVYPHNLRAMSNLGWSYLKVGRYAEALGVYEPYLERDPGDLDVWKSGGHAAMQIGDAARSATMYARATQLAPRDSGAWMGLGVALQSVGDKEGAESAFITGTSLAPQDYEPWHNLGVLYALSLRPDAARDAFERAFQSPKAPPSAALDLSQANIALGRCQEARAVMMEVDASALDVAGQKRFVMLGERWRNRCESR
ncbi:MAG: tetratricopeptide repeat protein [Nitrospirota bacterium]|nr:tetratricopeptide repeat protein [Nitrospirota bacterium]